MTSLTASQFLEMASERHASSPARRSGLRALFARMVAAAQADTARRSLGQVPDHLLRDIGLARGDIQVIDL